MMMMMMMMMMLRTWDDHAHLGNSENVDRLTVHWPRASALNRGPSSLAVRQWQK